MIPISNRNFSLLVDKLPALLNLIQSAGLPLRQQEDLRQMKVMCRQIARINNKLNSKKNDKK